jgi:hypothetical protein
LWTKPILSGLTISMGEIKKVLFQGKNLKVFLI